MKKFARIFFATVLGTSALFAQQSMTMRSTAEQFDNDIDKFMSVNDWSEVEPERAFLFIGENNFNALNIGFAKQFSSLYFGTYFAGNLPTFTFKKEEKKNEEKTTMPSLESSFLFGFKNMGIKANLKLSDMNSKANFHKTDKDAKTEEWGRKFVLDTGVDFGINLGSDKVYKVNAGIALSSYVSKSKKKVDGSMDSFSDDSNYTLRLKGGVESDYADDGSITQTWGVDAVTDFIIFPLKTGYNISFKNYEYTKGTFTFALGVEPKWALKYITEDEKFALKFTTQAEFGTYMDKGYDYRETGGKKTYNASRETNTNFSVTPKFRLGFEYAPKEVIKLHAGIGVACPSIDTKIIKVEDRKADSGALKDTAKSSDTSLKGDLKGELSLGFAWYVTPNVAFDASWNILSGFSTSINQIMSSTLSFAIAAKF